MRTLALVSYDHFFVDPLTAQPHDPDVQALMRVCNVHNVALATNLAAADFVIAALAQRERDEIARLARSAA